LKGIVGLVVRDDQGAGAGLVDEADGPSARTGEPRLVAAESRPVRLAVRGRTHLSVLALHNTRGELYVYTFMYFLAFYAVSSLFPSNNSPSTGQSDQALPSKQVRRNVTPETARQCCSFHSLNFYARIFRAHAAVLEATHCDCKMDGFLQQSGTHLRGFLWSWCKGKSVVGCLKSGSSGRRTLPAPPIGRYPHHFRSGCAAT
jgi:hypothetical protein